MTDKAQASQTSPRGFAVLGPLVAMPAGARVALALAAFDVFVGAMVLVGWALGVQDITSFGPGPVAMKPNVALSLVLLGTALGVYLLPFGPTGCRIAVVLRNALSVAVGAIAIATLLEYAAGVNLGLDQALFNDLPGAAPFPGRPPISASLALLASAAAAPLLGRRWRGYHPSQLLAAFVGSIGGLVLLGYAYGAQDLMSLGSPNQASFLAAPALISLGLCLLVANKRHGLVELFTDPGPAGQVARRIGPAALLVVPVGAFLRMEGERAGLFDMPIGLALMVLLEALLLVAVGAWTSITLLGADAARAQANRDRDRFFELSSDLVLVTDLSGRIVEMSPSWEAAMGRKRDDMVGRSFLEFEHPEDRSASTERLGQLPTEGGYSGIVNRYLSADGTPRWLEWRSTVDHAAGRIFAVARDVTEQKRTEETLRERSAYARGLLEASLDPLVTISPEGKITDVNRATEEVTGHPRKKLIGRDFADYFTEPALAREGYKLVLSKGLVRDYPLTIRHASGRTTDVLYNATVYRNEKGEPQGVFAAARDVTEQKRLMTELEKREVVLREQAGLLELAHDAIFVRGTDGVIRFWNAGAERMYGWTESEAIGKVTHHLLATAFPESLEALNRSLLETDAWEGRLRHTTKAGNRLIVESRQALERDEHGNPNGVLEINRDVTEAATALQRLEQSAEELRRSNSELEQFAYVASHDLQEPLRMVTGFVGLLQHRYGGKLDADADEYIGFAVEGAHRMQNLINDLLAYSRVGTRGHAAEPVDFGEVLDEVLVNLRVAIDESGARVERDKLPVVQADRHQMVQLLQNLVGNAIKFHGDEPPRIQVGSRRSEEGWQIYVRDNGIGIDPQYRDQVFVIFRRLHSRDAYAGSGIGLAICKKIVERHGGRIWFESESGSGSTFWFTLPDVPGSELSGA